MDGWHSHRTQSTTKTRQAINALQQRQQRQQLLEDQWDGEPSDSATTTATSSCTQQNRRTEAHKTGELFGLVGGKRKCRNHRWCWSCSCSANHHHHQQQQQQSATTTTINNYWMALATQGLGLSAGAGNGLGWLVVFRRVTHSLSSCGYLNVILTICKTQLKIFQ